MLKKKPEVIPYMGFLRRPLGALNPLIRTLLPDIQRMPPLTPFPTALPLTTKKECVTELKGVCLLAQGRDETDPSGEKTKAGARPESEGGRLEASGEDSSSSWEEHLGDPSDPKSSIMIRFPDGQREAKNIPSSSTFMVSFGRMH